MAPQKHPVPQSCWVQVFIIGIQNWRSIWLVEKEGMFLQSTWSPVPYLPKILKLEFRYVDLTKFESCHIDKC